MRIEPRRYPSTHSDPIDHRIRRKDEQWGRRSLLFLRADDERHLASGLSTAADGIVLDLETVPSPHLAAVRATTRNVLESENFGAKEKIVRIHGVAGDMWYEDLLAVMPGRPDTILPAWAQSRDEMLVLDAVLRELERQEGIELGSTRLMPLIEVLPGLHNVVEIAHSTPRISALMFGAGDYGMDMDHHYPDREELNILYARQRVVEAARLAGIDAIDTPWFGWEPMAHKNLDAYRVCTERARFLGFDGKAAHTPGQVDVCNDVFVPSDDELEAAEKFIATQEAHYDGSFGERNEYYLDAWTWPAEGMLIRKRRGQESPLAR